MATSTFRVHHLPADSQTPPLAAAALSHAAESPERHCGGGWFRVVKVRRLLLCVVASSGSSFNDSSMAAGVWVVAVV